MVTPPAKHMIKGFRRISENITTYVCVCFVYLSSMIKLQCIHWNPCRYSPCLRNRKNVRRNNKYTHRMNRQWLPFDKMQQVNYRNWWLPWTECCCSSSSLWISWESIDYGQLKQTVLFFYLERQTTVNKLQQHVFCSFHETSFFFVIFAAQQESIMCTQRSVSITRETPRGGGLDLFPKNLHECICFTLTFDYVKFE